MSSQIASLASPAAANAGQFGAKAATLARLKADGVAVPDGVAIGAAEYLLAIDAADLPNRGSFQNFKAWAAAVHQTMLNAQPAPALLEELTPQLQQIGQGPFIVRSSAVGEDGATSSFAGQLDSVCDVTQENLADAIRQVWASAWSSRAAVYREHRELTAVDDLAVGILVQPFIEPDFAGVAFTSSPIPDEEGMVVEAVQGRGDQLVSGSAVPARYRFDEFGQPLPDPGHTPFAMPTGLLRELFATGQLLVSTLGAAQDIEWLTVGDDLILVQARPITTVPTAHNDLADPDDFVVSVHVVEAASRHSIPDHLAAKDKFRLRLIASEAAVPVGRGWLISVSRRADDHRDHDLADSIHEAAATIASQVERFPQVSMVLQNPGRLDGGILRKFTDLDSIEENLRSLISKAGAQHDDFQMIATEILQAHMSGISHLVDDELVVEVAFGSYVPKGIVPTSLYVSTADGSVRQHTEVTQETGTFIENGSPQDRAVGASAVLDTDQLASIRTITQVISDAYPDVSVEFGVLKDGFCYLIDIIPDMTPVNVTDVRVMSPGSITGVSQTSKSDDLAAESLDAHFHSERTAGGSSGSSSIVIAPRPFLALETHLAANGPAGVGFIFDQGSLLGHLAIILREHGVPAIVVAGACDSLPDGTLITIDTATEDLYTVAGPTE